MSYFNKFLCFLFILYLSCNLYGNDTITTTYFHTNCSACQKVANLLKKLQKSYPNLSIKKYHLQEDINNISIMREYYENYKVPPEKWSGSFALFIGEKYYIDTEKALENLKGDIANFKTPPNKALEDTLSLQKKDTTILSITTPNNQVYDNKLIHIFKNFGIFTIISAGLIDGINPCAFSVLIFFFSYLSLMKRSKREIFFTGLMFTLGVFLAYLLIGIGLFQAFFRLSAVPFFSKLLYPLITLITLVLTIYSYFDYRSAKLKKNKNIKIKLPHKFVQYIHKVIRTQMKMKHFMSIAFVSGLLISVLELACTGQIYFPTIMYIIGVPGLKVKALIYLLLYVIMFIIPLLIVFALVLFGTTSEKLTKFAQKNIALAKILMFFIFFLLTGYMLYISGQIYGLWS